VSLRTPRSSHRCRTKKESPSRSDPETAAGQIGGALLVGRGSDDVELLGHVRLLADQVRHLAEIRDLLPDGDQAESLLGLVRDPVAALRERRQAPAQLVERRLRVGERPDQDPRDQNGPRGW
jgi:hypothetical protein